MMLNIAMLPDFTLCNFMSALVFQYSDGGGEVPPLRLSFRTYACEKDRARACVAMLALTDPAPGTGCPALSDSLPSRISAPSRATPIARLRRSRARAIEAGTEQTPSTGEITFKPFKYMLNRSQAALMLSVAKLWEQCAGEVYFWTLTFEKTRHDWAASYCASNFFRTLDDWHPFKLPGIKVLEPHPGGHGVHVHFLIGRRVSIHIIQRIAKRHGFGVVTWVRRAVPEDAEYVAKYVGKPSAKLFHVRKWSCFGGFKGVRAKDVEIDSPFHRAIREINAEFGRITYFETLMLSNAVRVDEDRWRSSHLLPERFRKRGAFELSDNWIPAGAKLDSAWLPEIDLSEYHSDGKPIAKGEVSDCAPKIRELSFEEKLAIARAEANAFNREEWRRHRECIRLGIKWQPAGEKKFQENLGKLAKSSELAAKSYAQKAERLSNIKPPPPMSPLASSASTSELTRRDYILKPTPKSLSSKRLKSL